MEVQNAVATNFHAQSIVKMGVAAALNSVPQTAGKANYNPSTVVWKGVLDKATSRFSGIYFGTFG